MATASPAARRLLGPLLHGREFMSDGLNGISAGSDGVPTAVGQSLCMTECDAWFRQPLSEQRTGKKWTTLRPVFPGGGTAGLSAVSALSGKDVWATGSLHDSSTAGGGFVEHWNGKKWVLVPSAIGQGVNLNAVAAVSDDDVWAAGGSSSGGIIQHWDGKNWTESGSPDPNRGVNGLDALSTSDVWAVGTDISTYTPFAEHWDGSSWQNVDVPVPSGTVITVLLGVSGTGPDDVWAVGEYLASSGDIYGLTEHWDGSTWSIVNSVDRGNCGATAVAALASDDVWTVGACAVPGGEVTLTEHWNGTTWTRVKSPNIKGEANNQFWSVTAVAADDVWAAGDTPDTNAYTDSVLLEHWNGSEWSLVRGKNPQPHPRPKESVATSRAAHSASPSQQTHLSVSPIQASSTDSPHARVCFSNLDGDSSLGVNSQTYESTYSAYDDEAAADVTLARTCRLRSLTVLGTAPCHFVQSEVVTIYADDDGAPGDKINRQTVDGSIVDDRCGSFEMPLKAVDLKPGTYWISVVVNLSLMPQGGEWTWDESTQRSGSRDAWRSIGRAYGLCRDWGDLNFCTLADNSDLALQLSTSEAS